MASTEQATAINNPVPMGGTEILYTGLQRHIPSEWLAKVHISLSAVDSAAPHLKPHILWAHQSYDQPSVQNLKDPRVLATIDTVVCVSEWQAYNYHQYLGVPQDKVCVIRNAIEPITTTAKKEPIKLIYTSTPFRGLNVLLKAFEFIVDQDVELHIYSGMDLYGRPEENTRFDHLYQKAKQQKNVFFHGVVTNAEVREALQQAHIFAYPNTWEETSCLALIEALAAGCLAVIPDKGALKETSSGYAQMYEFTENSRQHSELFAEQLKKAIQRIRQDHFEDDKEKQIHYFNSEYSWENRKHEWIELIKQLS